MDNFEFFGPTFGNLLDYVRYFGSNNIEGVAESWVEVQMSWVEVDGAGCTFSNTLLKFCFKAIISCRFIICFRILWFHLSLMSSSKNISASQRLNFSLDFLFILGILPGNSSTLNKVLEPFLPLNSCLILAESLAHFPCLFSYWLSSSRKFSIIGLIFGSKFSFCTNFIVFFLSFEILISWLVEVLEKVLAFSLKLDLLFPHQAFAEEVVFCVFKKKKHILSWNCNIFLSGETVRKNSSIPLKLDLEWWSFWEIS